MAAPPPRPGAAGSRAESLPGPFTIDCLKSGLYGLRNIWGMMKLVLFAGASLGVLMYVFRLYQAALIWSAWGRVALSLMYLGIQIIVGGYYLRFLLDCITSSLEGSDESPEVPGISPGDYWWIGVKGLGIMLLYVLPVVTLPLLPVALLALSYHEDARAFDPIWCAKAALRRPGRYVTVLLILGLYAVLSIVAIVFVSAGFGFVMIAGASFWDTAGGFMALLLFLLFMSLTLSTLITMEAAIFFRCVGMLGRYEPGIFAMLPDEPNKPKAYAWVGGGLAAVVTMTIVAGNSLESLLPEPPPVAVAPMAAGGLGNGLVPVEQPPVEIDPTPEKHAQLTSLYQGMYQYMEKNEDKYPADLTEIEDPHQDYSMQYLPPIDRENVVFLPPNKTIMRTDAMLGYHRVPYKGKFSIVTCNGMLLELPEQEFTARVVGRTGSRPSSLPASTSPDSRPGSLPLRDSLGSRPSRRVESGK